MNTPELIEWLRAQADFIDADTYDECWEVKETPRGKMLRAAASCLSEMDAEIKRLREAMRLIADRPTNIPIDPHGMAQFARAALEQQP